MVCESCAVTSWRSEVKKLTSVSFSGIMWVMSMVPKRNKAYAIDFVELYQRAVVSRTRNREPARDLETLELENARISPREARAARIHRDLVAASLLDRCTIGELPHTHFEIATLLASGWRNAPIARRLKLSDKTVTACRRDILKATGAHTVEMLRQMAIEQKIIIDTGAQLGHTAEMAKPKDFKINVNKHTSRVLTNIKAMSALGPQCDDPAAIEKVRTAVNKELDQLAAHWKNKTAPATSGFAL